MRPWPSDNDVKNSVSATIEELILATRLIGEDPELVLAGGGNSSLKTTRTDVTGREIEILLVKASGRDMGVADEDSFAPLRLARLRELLPPTPLSDDQLPNELRCALLDASAPDPSVETLTHAALPHAAVLHSHADIVLAITDTRSTSDHAAEAFGAHVLVLPYAMPGVDLARDVQQAWSDRGSDEIVGLVVEKHGLFTFGATPREAYERHVAVIESAQEYLAAQGAPERPDVAPSLLEVPLVEIAALRREISDAAGRDLIVRRTTSELVARVVADPALLDAAARGPLTPDHATRTKPFPLVGRDVAAYADAYRTYVASHRDRRGAEITELDPAPRVVLDEQLGLLTAGVSASDAADNAAITEHTLSTVLMAEKLGGYSPADAGHVFDLEYWSIQQQKMMRGRLSRELDGQVAIVTGAASGIGKGCAKALLDAGAVVVGWDLSPSVASTFEGPNWLGLEVDVSDEARVREALRTTVESFGGLDILVPSAGIFPSSKPLGEMELEAWTRTMRINVDSVVTLYGLAWPLLEQSRQGGRVVVIASKNVLAPGTGAAAYSSSKAALTQLSRVAALEWAPKGIRVNMVHPDAVFDTGLWTPELLAARAEHYGLTVDQYKRRNLLRTEVTSATVGQLVLAMATEPFRCTTGAQVPIDGGSDRVI